MSGETRYYRLPPWWKQCESALRNLRQNRRMIHDIESVYCQPGHDLDTIRVHGGDGATGLENTVDRMTADRYLNRLKREVAAIEETDTAIVTAYGEEDGGRRLETIRMLYVNHTHTAEGVAQELHISVRTAHYYRASYLHMLACRLGYEKARK